MGYIRTSIEEGRCAWGPLVDATRGEDLAHVDEGCRTGHAQREAEREVVEPLDDVERRLQTKEAVLAVAQAEAARDTARLDEGIAVQIQVASELPKVHVRGLQAIYCELINCNKASDGRSIGIGVIEGAASGGDGRYTEIALVGFRVVGANCDSAG